MAALNPAFGRDRLRVLAGRLAWHAAGVAREVEAFALPMRCPVCASEIGADVPLCEPCAAAIPRLEEPLCVRCLAAGGEAPGCRREPAYLAWAAWVYDERAACAVQALKYQGRPRLAGTLGRSIADALPSAYRADLVVEVPLHPARLRERGYNQAAGLADAVAQRIGSPRLIDALVRRRPTQPQARLGAAARRSNLADSIRVVGPQALEGRSILVVDDVITTGSTMEACLQALADCGARAVGAALAWAP